MKEGGGRGRGRGRRGEGEGFLGGLDYGWRFVLCFLFFDLDWIFR